MNWSVQEQVIQEFRTIGETTLLTDGGYVDWAKDWLTRQGYAFTAREIESCTVIKLKNPKQARYT